MQSPCSKRQRPRNSNPRAIEVGEVIAISSDEDVEDEDSNYYARGDGVPKPTAIVRRLMRDAREQWRSMYIFSMKGSEITIPRGIALYPQLVHGPYESSFQTVETHVRAILARRQRPLFYIGSTTNLVIRWGFKADKDGCLVGHAFTKNIHWHTMLAIYRTNQGSCCASMEEKLLEVFSRKTFTDGCCVNISMKANGVQKSSRVVHWVYVLLTKILGLALWELGPVV